MTSDLWRQNVTPAVWGYIGGANMCLFLLLRERVCGLWGWGDSAVAAVSNMHYPRRESRGCE